MKYSPSLKLLWFLFYFICFVSVGWSQNQYKGFVIEALNATSTNSQRHFQYNETNRWYFEGRAGYRFNRYFEMSASVGYQLRHLFYFAVFNQPYSENAIVMDRHYLPVAVNSRLYISDFFYEKLHLWKKQNKWDVYVQVSLGMNKGHDVRSPYEDEIRAQGGLVPFYKYPYVDIYNRLQVSYVAGVRHNFNKHIGLFIEGGEGLLMNGVIGLSCKF